MFRYRHVPLAPLALLLFASCYQSHGLDSGLDGGRPPRRDARPPRRDATPPRVDAFVPRPPTAAPPVDVLFLVDNSNSMIEEQVSLKERFPELVDSLTSGEVGGRADAVRSFPPVDDIHLGVVDSDMGTGGYLVPTCSESNFGDDGILRTRGDVSAGGCSSSYPSFLSFRAGDSATTFAADASCLASLGTGGCGFEQPLDAVLKALTPTTSATTFYRGTRGHGDTENAGFLRPNSILAVVLLTDEDDCSASDPDLYNQSSPRYMGDLNLRCFMFPEALYPVDRYVSGLLDLRADPSRLVFTVIAGVPVDLTLARDRTRFGDILADPRMREQPDPSMPSRLLPSCNVPGRGLAFPPRRLVEVARDLERSGAHTSVGSICQADYSAPIRTLVNRIADAIEGR
ncbi:MAG: hypothetical protein GXP55_20780 [Deltaproteobacteria bacterium]|nr:hypothetical protein [Deltaproteobacteria bacterium]